MRRALQVSGRREAAEAESVRRGSGPSLAVKQALSLSSPARPLFLPRRGCLPRAPADRSRVRGWSHGLRPHGAPHARHSPLGVGRRGRGARGTPLRLNFPRACTPSRETDPSASHPRSPNPTRVYFSKVVCTQVGTGRGGGGAGCGQGQALIRARRCPEARGHPFLPPEGLELKWSLQEHYPTSGPLKLALGCSPPRHGAGKPVQVA